MRFIVSRTSYNIDPLIWTAAAPPCEGALYLDNGFYTIEIDSLDELLALAGREGDIIVALNDASNTIAGARIEIYDADRES